MAEHLYFTAPFVFGKLYKFCCLTNFFFLEIIQDLFDNSQAPPQSLRASTIDGSYKPTT